MLEMFALSTLRTFGTSLLFLSIVSLEMDVPISKCISQTLGAILEWNANCDRTLRHCTHEMHF